MKNKTKTVINKNGAVIFWNAAVSLMDTDILDGVVEPGMSEQVIFSEYEKRHETKYGEEWELSKENPCY